MEKFSANEVSRYLSDNLKNWTLDDNSIRRDFKFMNFTEAFSFMTEVALHAEKMDHHPDWKNVYDTVDVKLSTHSAGGVTTKDYDLAGSADKAYKKYADRL